MVTSRKIFEWEEKLQNPDKTVNEYGRKLWSLCKSSGLRILNGRHNHGFDRDYTFMGARGLSEVDYCISTPNVFHLIEKFIISNFTTFSDHGPLHLQFKTKTSECKQQLNPCCDSVNNAHPARKFRWNPEYEYEAKLELRKALETFDAFLEVPDEESQDKIDASIDGFTKLVSKTMAPFFAIEYPPERKLRYLADGVREQTMVDSRKES